MHREIRKLTKKIDELQKQLNQQNEYIMDQTLIIQKLIEKLIVIPSVPSVPSIDPHFGKDIPYVPYKGPDCETTTITDWENIFGSTRTMTPEESQSLDEFFWKELKRIL